MLYCVLTTASPARLCLTDRISRPLVSLASLRRRSSSPYSIEYWSSSLLAGLPNPRRGPANRSVRQSLIVAYVFERATGYGYYYRTQHQIESISKLLELEQKGVLNSTELAPAYRTVAKGLRDED